MKLLVDECLSEELSKLARQRGHAESSHVRWIGKTGAKDWELLPVILDGDWTFGPIGMNLEIQLELFEIALDALDEDDDLVNQALEITLEQSTDTEISIIRYVLPHLTPR